MVREEPLKLRVAGSNPVQRTRIKYTTMKKLITTIIALSAGLVSAQTVNNWVNAGGTPWKNASGQCWRNTAWTPATAHADCDGAVKAPAAAAVVEQPRVSATFAAPVTKVPEPAKPVATKITYSADAFFDFDRSVLKPEGKAKLDKLVYDLKSVNLEIIVAVGHTDSIGSDAYNIKLGNRRAGAVKAYLVSKGIEPMRVYTDSKGERQPIADNKTAQGRAMNRRVEIEVVGAAK